MKNLLSNRDVDASTYKEIRKLNDNPASNTPKTNWPEIVKPQ